PKAAWAKASPDSLSTTRCQRDSAPAGGWPSTPLASHLYLGEAGDGRVAKQLLDRLLGVFHVLLLEQHVLGEEATGELALDDLGDRLFGLALIAGLGFEDLALLLHPLGRNLVAGEELGAGEGDVE